MKQFPLRSKEITIRGGRRPDTRWTQIIWSDKSMSWRKVYTDKKTQKKYVVNRGKFYEMFWNSQFGYYNFKRLKDEEIEELQFEHNPRINEEEDDEIEIEVEEVKTTNSNGQFVEFNPNAIHPEKETVLKALKKNIPVYLVGPAGTGKSTVLKQVAEELGMNFFSTNAIQDEYKITGFKDASGDYQDTEFYKAWTQGGVFFIDEMDASIPGVLTLLNTAIANRYFEFPNGRKDAHPDFRIVAAGNTFGNGADEVYTGRLVLDGATLDRFLVVEYGYNYEVELAIAKGNKWLVDFIEELRKIALRNGLRQTFSYRAIEMIRDLEEDFPLEKLLKMTVFKGMDNETIRLFQTAECNTSYEKATEKLIERAA